LKRGAPRVNRWSLTDWDGARLLIPLPGRFADGQSTHRHPRWGGPRRGSGRPPQRAASTAQFVKLGCALTPRQIALLDAHSQQFETPSRSASLRGILDDYIASVPALAATLDHIAAPIRAVLRTRRR
jgi:hypothetical protein